MDLGEVFYNANLEEREKKERKSFFVEHEKSEMLKSVICIIGK